MQAATAARSPPRLVAGKPVAAATAVASPGRGGGGGGGKSRRALLRPPPRAAAADDRAAATTTATTTTTTTPVLDLWTLHGGKKDQLPRPVNGATTTAPAAPPPVPAELDTPLLPLAAANDQQHHHQYQPPPYAHGSVELITGPMFSGKSTALLERATLLTADGRSVALVKPRCDRRYATHLLVSHSGKAARCHRVSRLSELPALLGPERWARLDAVLVDEGQFFDDLVEFSAAASEGCGVGGRGGGDDDDDDAAENEKENENQPEFVRPKAVVVAGLSGDFRRRPFGRVAELLPLADRVRALRARCFACGADAPFSLRLCGEAAQVLVGGAEAYRPACRGCFARHHQKEETEAP